MIKKAIILAAGMGTRLLPLTQKKHKCLTEVAGVPIIINALSCLNAIDVSETVIVVGYLADDIKRVIGNNFKSMRISYVENNIFRVTNTAYSLMQGLKHVGDYDSIYVLEGDVFFEGKLLNVFSESKHDNATVLEPYNPLLDGTFVTKDSNGYVTDWIHKNYRESTFAFDGKYKTVNIHKFSSDFVNRILLPELNIVYGEAERNVPLERVMQSIVRKYPRMIYGINTDGVKWFEIDDQNDLRIAQSLFGDEINGDIERII